MPHTQLPHKAPGCSQALRRPLPTTSLKPWGSGPPSQNQTPKPRDTLLSSSLCSSLSPPLAGTAWPPCSLVRRRSGEVGVASAMEDGRPRLGRAHLSRWTPRSLGRMGQLRARCQEGEAGGCVCVWGGWVTEQVRLEKLETRPVMATTAPGTRRLPRVHPTGQAPSYRPVRCLGFPTQEPVQGPVVPGTSGGFEGGMCPLVCGLGQQEACSDSVPPTHPQVLRQRGPRQPSRVATRSQPASGPCTTW